MVWLFLMTFPGWVFLTADLRGAQAPDVPVCLAAGRDEDADKTTSLLPVQPIYFVCQGSRWGWWRALPGARVPRVVGPSPVAVLSFPETTPITAFLPCTSLPSASSCPVCLPSQPSPHRVALCHRQCCAGLSCCPSPVASWKHPGQCSSVGGERVTNDVFLSEVFKHAAIRRGLIFFLWLGASIKIETNFAFPKRADNCSMTQRANTRAEMASSLNVCWTELLVRYTSD